MKITDKTRTKTSTQLFTVKDANYISGYKLRVRFSNGRTKTVDCANFLKKIPHPSLKKYLSISQFKKFKIQNGNINWNNYEMIFPIEDLYKGKVD